MSGNAPYRYPTGRRGSDDPPVSSPEFRYVYGWNRSSEAAGVTIRRGSILPEHIVYIPRIKRFLRFIRDIYIDNSPSLECVSERCSFVLSLTFLLLFTTVVVYDV
jgi:hypothetical protein